MTQGSLFVEHDRTNKKGQDDFELAGHKPNAGRVRKGCIHYGRERFSKLQACLTAMEEDHAIWIDGMQQRWNALWCIQVGNRSCCHVAGIEWLSVSLSMQIARGKGRLGNTRVSR